MSDSYKHILKVKVHGVATQKQKHESELQRAYVEHCATAVWPKTSRWTGTKRKTTVYYNSGFHSSDISYDNSLSTKVITESL